MEYNNLFVEKKINKKIIITIFFYILILVIVLAGIIKFNCTSDGKFNFEIKKCIDFSRGIGIYNKWLIDFDNKPIKLLTEKNCINGIYIFRIIYYFIILTCLIYLPILSKDLKKRFYNKNNLAITKNNLYGTRFYLFKTREFNIKLKDIKQIIIKKNKFKSFFGKEKLILVTESEIIKVYFIKDINNVYDNINVLAKQNNAIYDTDAYKKLKKESLKNVLLNLKKVVIKVIGFLNLKELFNNKSDLEIKLDKIKELKDSNQITDEEYLQLREKIINENSK